MISVTATPSLLVGSLGRSIPPRAVCHVEWSMRRLITDSGRPCFGSSPRPSRGLWPASTVRKPVPTAVERVYLEATLHKRHRQRGGLALLKGEVMSGPASLRAHAANRALRLQGFLRRNVGVLVVLGVAVTFAAPAAQASFGDPVLAGLRTTSSQTTELTTTNGEGLWGESTDPNPGTSGLLGTNVHGGMGVEGQSQYNNGVYGSSGSQGASGVYGTNDSGGYGVAGQTTHGGIAVFAQTPDGTGIALDTTGTIRFQNRSGNVRVPSGQTSLKVFLGGVTSSSMVLATVQRAGGFFASAIPAAGSFTIYLNKAAAGGASVKVAYLVLN